MRQPPWKSERRATLKVVHPDGEDVRLHEMFCATESSVAQNEPTYQWLRPDPRRTLPRTRVLVLRLTFREAQRLMSFVFPYEEAASRMHVEAHMTSALGAMLYGALVKHGYLRVSQNGEGVRLVRADTSRFSLTYPCIEPDQEIRVSDRVRMIHRTDSVWRSAKGTWVQLLHAAHEAAFRGVFRPRGDWEIERRYARQQRRSAYERRRSDTRDARLSTVRFPTFRFTLTREHAAALLILLHKSHTSSTTCVRLRELNRCIGVRVTRLLRGCGAFIPVNGGESSVDNPYFRCRTEYFDQYLFRLTHHEREEGYERLTEPRLLTTCLWHHAYFRLAELLRKTRSQ